MFRFLKITMLDCVYVRATSTERRYIACTGLKFIFHNGVNFDYFTWERRLPFPLIRQNQHRKPSEDRVISLGKGNRLVLNKHLSGIKKARYLFEPITETHRTAPAVLTLTGANVGIKF